MAVVELAQNEGIDELIGAVAELRAECVGVESMLEEDILAIPRSYQRSARNLAHYLALRQHDVRDLQRRLHRLGLSSLGRLEAHTLAGLDAVLRALYGLRAGRRKSFAATRGAVSFEEGPELLSRHAEALLGPASGPAARIMVTMPSEAANRYELARDLVAAGMSVMRINCAHDDVSDWTRMAKHLRRAVREVGRPCRLLVDLGGPKLRTGAIEAGARVVRWKPKRDVRGRPIAPARVLIWSAPVAGRPSARFDAILPAGADFVQLARKGDSVRVQDARGRTRELMVRGTGRGYLWAEADHSCYAEQGAGLELVRGEEKIATTEVGELALVEQPLLLNAGDALIVTADSAPGQPARLIEGSGTTEAARIACTLPEAFRDVRAGHRIAFDDGAIWGVVRQATPEILEVEITHARPGGSKLGSDKGINLPDTDLQLPPLTEKDLRDMGFAVAEADLVGLSFVRGPEDVSLLQEKLREMHGERLGVLLKIETRAGFENLPRILLTALRMPPVGVMVARGDLAVELGFERMAEVQEEILWLCEAAHVPAIWATQVLEGLTKKGAPSRAEVTDAAMSTRAECVMLNKGPYVVDAVRFLAGVQQRMVLHHEKKIAMLRRLSVSDLTPARRKKAARAAS